MVYNKLKSKDVLIFGQCIHDTYVSVDAKLNNNDSKNKVKKELEDIINQLIPKCRKKLNIKDKYQTRILISSLALLITSQIYLLGFSNTDANLNTKSLAFSQIEEITTTYIDGQVTQQEIDNTNIKFQISENVNSSNYQEYYKTHLTKEEHENESVKEVEPSTITYYTEYKNDGNTYTRTKTTYEISNLDFNKLINATINDDIDTIKDLLNDKHLSSTTITSYEKPLDMNPNIEFNITEIKLDNATMETIDKHNIFDKTLIVMLSISSSTLIFMLISEILKQIFKPINKKIMNDPDVFDYECYQGLYLELFKDYYEPKKLKKEKK